MTDLHEHAADMHQLVARRADQVADSWSGSAHMSWAENAASVVVAWARLHTWADNERDALRRYVEAIESIKERAHRQQTLMAAAKTAASQPLDFLDPDTLTRRRRDLDEDLLAATASTRSALNTLALERQEAEDELARSLHSVHLEIDRKGHAILPAGLSFTKLAALDKQSLLAALDDMTATQIDELMSADLSLTQDFWNDPPEADKVAEWWATLSDQQRAELIAGAPSIVGNLGGIPYSARIDANRLQLEAAEARGGLSEEQRSAVAAAKKSLRSSRGRLPRGLIDLNLDHDPPLVALSIGDIERADQVTWSVPGMNSRASDLAGWADGCQNILNEQNRVDSSNHALVAWIGYATPNLEATESDFTSTNSVLMNTLAQQGSDRLAAELDAARTTLRGSGRLNVVAHSYGTTTAAYALTKTRFDVDSVTLVASAGIDSKAVPHAGALHVKAHKNRASVFSTQASADRIATIGRTVKPDILDSVLKSITRIDVTSVSANNRVNPDSAFGAQPFSSEGTESADGDLLATLGHDTIGSGGLPVVSAAKGHGYFDKHTESLRNIALLSTGHPAAKRSTPLSIPRTVWPRL